MKVNVWQLWVLCDTFLSNLFPHLTYPWLSNFAPDVNSREKILNSLIKFLDIATQVDDFINSCVQGAVENKEQLIQWVLIGVKSSILCQLHKFNDVNTSCGQWWKIYNPFTKTRKKMSVYLKLPETQYYNTTLQQSQISAQWNNRNE